MAHSSYFFNKNVKYIRGLKGISQQTLADKLNVDRSTISKWKMNEITANVDNALEASRALNVPVEYLIGQDLTHMTLEEIESLNDNVNKMYKDLNKREQSIAKDIINVVHKHQNDLDDIK